MVYKKYIYKNGKRYGPYIYHSKRVDGKVISEYHGSGNSEFSFNKKFLWMFLGLALVFGMIYFVGNFGEITGKFTFDLGGNYVEGEPLNGAIRLSLKEGEFIPASTKIVFENYGETYEYELQELTTAEAVEGNFYVEDKSISGSGLGYGIEGEKEIPQTVYFTLEIEKEILSEPEISESEGETGPEESASGVEEGGEESEGTSEEPETSEEIPDEGEETIEESETDSDKDKDKEKDKEEKVKSKDVLVEVAGGEESEHPEIAEESANSESESTSESSSEESSSVSESSGEESAPITGEFIKPITRFFSKAFLSLTGQVSENSENQGEINGEVSLVSAFEYGLKKGYTAKIKSGSARIKQMNNEGIIEYIEIGDGNLDLEIAEDVAIVTTDYSEIESGFGKDYLGEEGKVLAIDLSQLDLNFEPGELVIRLVYEGEEILSLEATLAEGEISIEDMTGKNISESDKIKSGEIFLTEEEKEILLKEFGNETSVKTTAIEHSGGVEAKFEFGGKSATRFYDLELGNAKLEKWMQKDIVDWLKDLAHEFLKEDIEAEEIEDLKKEFMLGNFETKNESIKEILEEPKKEKVEGEISDEEINEESVEEINESVNS